MTSTKGTSSKDAKSHRALEVTCGRNTMDKVHMVTKTLCTKDTRQGSFVSRTSTAQVAVKATDGSGTKDCQKTKKDATCVDSKEQREYHHTKASIVRLQEEEKSSKVYKQELTTG